MKTLSKKIISIILISVMGSSLLAGCGTKTTAVKTDISKEGPLKIRLMSQLFEDVPDMKNEWWTEFQKKTNTEWTIDWVPNGDYRTKLDLVLASGDLPDVLVSDDLIRPTLLSAIKGGAFWDLTPLLGDFSKYPNLKNNVTPNAFKYLTVDGKIWGIPRSRSQTDLGMKIRKDWLDKLNIPMPTTLDEYRAALKKIVTGDPDGNGKNDTLGLIGFGFVMNYSDGLLINAFGGYNTNLDSNGGLIHPNLKPEYADYVEYLRGLYSDGSLAKEFSTMKSTQAEESFTAGRAASFTQNIWRDYVFEQQIKKVQTNAEVVSIPPMKGPKGTTAMWALGVYGAFYISKKVPEEKVKRILDFYEKTCTQEWLDMGYFGIQGVHYTMVDGQKTLTELGKKQVGTSVQQPIPMMANNWAKVMSPSAPKAYNDAKLKSVEQITKTGNINPFEVLVSDTWTNTWPKYEQEWQAQTIKAIVGQISMNEYKSYVEKLRNTTELKTSFQELAKAYKDRFGK